jgi:hypothetical protein
MRGVTSSDLELERDRFKVWPCHLNRLSFVAISYGRQGSTRRVTARPKTIHLLHAHCTSAIARSDIGGKRGALGHSDACVLSNRRIVVLALRHQLGVLRRSVKRPKLTAADRLSLGMAM